MADARRLDPAGNDAGPPRVTDEHSAAASPVPGDIHEQRFRALIERMPGIVYIETDATPGPTVYVSPRIEEILGYAPEPFIRDQSFWGELMHPDDLPAAVAADNRAGETGETYSAEYRLRDTAGAWHWFRDEAVYVPGEAGEGGYWQGLMVEITARKEIESELHEAAAKFRTLVEQIPAITYIDPLEPEPVPSMYVSPQIEELVGIRAEQALEDPEWWLRVIHPDDREEALRASDRADESGDPFVHEYRMMGPNGKITWVRDHSTLVRDASGEPLFWQGVIFDISERKRGEQELLRALELEQRAVRRLEEADEMKNTFLTAVSHDLRTPLTAILGTALTLEQEGTELTPDERRDMLRSLATKARHLTDLVTDLLDLERLTTGPVEPRRQDVDLRGLVEGVVANLDVLQGRRVVVVGATPVIAHVDASMVQRIVENMLTNAATHAPSDATIWARSEREDDGVLIAVEDDGPGVPQELRETLFHAFERGPSADAPGMGLGLSLVARFAQQLGGRAWVQDRVGGGASFRVWLPDGPS